MANFGLMRPPDRQAARRLAERQRPPRREPGRPCLRPHPPVTTASRRRSPISAIWSRRRRARASSSKTVRGPASAATIMRGHAAAGMPTGMLFGRERIGLTNEEISLADEIVTLPIDPRFASLNIAQAVLILAYEWRRSGLATEEEGLRFTTPDPSRPATKEETGRPLRASGRRARRGHLLPPAGEEAGRRADAARHAQPRRRSPSRISARCAASSRRWRTGRRGRARAPTARLTTAETRGERGLSVRLLVFDSGIGGLSVLRRSAAACPGAEIVYVADDAGLSLWRLGGGAALAIISSR